MTVTFQRFDESNFKIICDHLTSKDPDLASVIINYGYPPMWVRPATFETLVLTILEQQVSLASAYAAYRKLKEKIKRVTPSALLKLSDPELRSCYFSRQKIVYARELAEAIINRKLKLASFSDLPDEEIRSHLKKIKGIGDWTADVYLIHALRRTDIFPIGDIALVNSMREIKNIDRSVSKEHLLSMAESWRPYRTIASMILWHSYIRKRNIRIQG